MHKSMYVEAGDGSHPPIANAQRASGIYSNNFDSLRLILALLVIFSHSYMVGRGSNLIEPLYVLTGGQLTLGYISVWGFFGISGFLITKSWLGSPSVWKFLRHRVGRIYPGFTVAALICAFLVIPIATSIQSIRQISPLHFILHTLRLNIWELPYAFDRNAFPNSVNSSLWSIPFEFWCYLMTLLMGLLGVLRWRHLLSLIFLGLLCGRLLFDMTGSQPHWPFLANIIGDLYTWFVVLPFFMAGMLFHLYGGPRLIRTPWVVLSAVVLVVSVAIPHALLFTMPICGVYLLMKLAYARSLNFLDLGRRGDFSYGVYLYAWPIQQLVVMKAGGALNPLLLFAVAAPSALLLGMLSWFLVERHFIPAKIDRSRVSEAGNPTSASLVNNGLVEPCLVA